MVNKICIAHRPIPTEVITKGELALVVAKGGADVGTSNSLILPMIGTMTIITTFITQYLTKKGWKLMDIKQSIDGKTEKK